MTDCLTKPIDWARLFSVMDEVTSGNALEAAPQCVTATDNPLLRMQTLKQLAIQLGPEELAGYFQQALDGAEQSTSALEAEALAGKSAAIVREAHSLKGSAGLFGLRQISTIAGEIVSAAKEGSDVLPLLHELRLSVIDTRAELHISGLMSLPGADIHGEKERKVAGPIERETPEPADYRE